MKVGEVAARAGVNVETLRYYERRGLLPEPTREPSGHRRYDEETVRFLRAIKEAQAVGFTLAEIDEYLRAAKRSRKPSEALRVRMAAKIDEIDRRIAGLQRMREELARVVGCACDSLDHCTCGAAYLARRGREPRDAERCCTSRTARAPATRSARPRSAAPSCRGTTSCTRAPCRRSRARSCSASAAAFLSECGWGSRRAILSSLERRDEQFLEALRAGAHVVLWFEHDLYDQLQLIDALALAHDVGATPELIVVDTYLGTLQADELEEPLAGATHGDGRGARAGGRRVGRLPRSRPAPRSRELATEDALELPFLAPALAAPARGASRAGGRPLRNRAAGAPGNRRRRRDAGSGLRRRAAARGRGVLGRRLVLPHARRPRARLVETTDGNAAARSAAAERRQRLRTAADSPDARRPARARRQSRPRRARSTSTAGSAARTSRGRTSGAGTRGARQLESPPRAL